MIDHLADGAPIPILERYAALLETEPNAWVLVLQPGDTEGLLTKLRGHPFAMWEYARSGALIDIGDLTVDVSGTTTDGSYDIVEDGGTIQIGTSNVPTAQAPDEE